MKTKKCILCRKSIEGFGHNARPLAEGQCCTPCNGKVIAARLKKMKDSEPSGPVDPTKKIGEHEYFTLDASSGLERTIRLSCLQYDRYRALDYDKHQYSWSRVKDLISGELVWIQAMECGADCRCWMATLPDAAYQDMKERFGVLQSEAIVSILERERDRAK